MSEMIIYDCRRLIDETRSLWTLTHFLGNSRRPSNDLFHFSRLWNFQWKTFFFSFLGRSLKQSKNPCDRTCLLFCRTINLSISQFGDRKTTTTLSTTCEDMINFHRFLSIRWSKWQFYLNSIWKCHFFHRYACAIHAQSSERAFLSSRSGRELVKPNEIMQHNNLASTSTRQQPNRCESKMQKRALTKKKEQKLTWDVARVLENTVYYAPNRLNCTKSLWLVVCACCLVALNPLFVANNRPFSYSISSVSVQLQTVFSQARNQWSQENDVNNGVNFMATCH